MGTIESIVPEHWKSIYSHVEVISHGCQFSQEMVYQNKRLKEYSVVWGWGVS